MVILPGKKGIAAFVTLGDGEYLPANLNSPRVVVFRHGPSTDRQLRIIKPLGELASDDILRPPAEPENPCPGLNEPNNPLHSHPDGTWWFYDETWSLESGPYANKGVADLALKQYAKDLDSAKEEIKNETTDPLQRPSDFSDEEVTRILGLLKRGPDDSGNPPV